MGMHLYQIDMQYLSCKICWKCPERVNLVKFFFSLFELLLAISLLVSVCTSLCWKYRFDYLHFKNVFFVFIDRKLVECCRFKCISLLFLSFQHATGERWLDFIGWNFNFFMQIFDTQKFFRRKPSFVFCCLVKQEPSIICSKFLNNTKRSFRDEGVGNLNLIFNQLIVLITHSGVFCDCFRCENWIKFDEIN